MLTIGAKNSPFAINITVATPNIEEINVSAFFSLQMKKQAIKTAQLLNKKIISNAFQFLKIFFIINFNERINFRIKK